ncbi:hypothetical protein MJT46_016165 [Ovis ammon polii x Ovis aries]|nr:hypothetical protein MJT46_016165 [Ovis ammon polii x Ovis aries]
MSSNDSSLMAEIIYYSKEKYFRHVQQAAAVGLEKFNNDPVLQFFKAYGALREEHIQDAIGSLENIRNHPDVSLCSIMALIYAHKCCETIDREAIQELESSLKEVRKTASGTALYYAGLFLWLMGRHDKAKEYIDRTLKVSSSSREGHVLRGWVDLSSDKPHTVKKSIKYLEHGIQDTRDVLGLMGKVMYFTMLQNYSGALEVVNQITVTCGSFLPALVLKMQLFLARQDWEQTVEMGHRILEKDQSNIDACQILAVHELAREGNMTVCGRHQGILQLVCSFIERTFMATSSDARMATELGYLFILQDQVKEASLWYSQAMKLDESSVAALTGIIWCQILDGHLEEAEHQLEFLKEVQQSLGKSEVLVFLQALLASKKHRGEQEATTLLKEAAELHFSGMQALPMSSEYLERLDPTFLVCIAKEYLVFCPKQPRSPGQIVSPLLKQVAAILNPVVKVAPALTEPLYVMAQVKYLSGELEHAQSTLQRCLELDPTSVDAYLLMAQIYLAQGNFAMCSHSLELGVSHNFQVRDHPLYHFIKAKALNKSGDYPEAIKALKMIIKLPTLRTEENKKFRGPCVRPSERVSILLELADALRMNGELHEATKVMQDAINEFSGTPEEMRITIANVDLALSKGNVDLALSVLQSITPKQPCYMDAKEKMASIYLQTHKDARLYIGCYRKGEERDGRHFPHQPEKALEIYDEAYRKNPHDASLISRIGQAYVKTHQYTKAMDLQSRILKRVPLEQPEMIPSQKQLAASICIQFGEYYLAEKEYAKAVQSYKDALSYTPIDNKVMADLMFRRQKYEAAIDLYHQVLEKAPDNFPVLNKLIDLLRRSGKLEDAPAFFELAKKMSSRVPLEPGFNYCRGIYCWHIGQPNEALKFLNKARKDRTWGQSATYHMVQICLNPDNEIVGGEAFQNLVTESNFTSRKELEQHGVRTAEKLLREFYPHSAGGHTQLRLLQSLCLLATREKANVEVALSTFVEMAQAEVHWLPGWAGGQAGGMLRRRAGRQDACFPPAQKDSVPALLAMAQACSLLKQIPKARTQLKRLAKAPWALAEADDLERSWLLLADIYCQGGKFDLASELLQRCVKYNKARGASPLGLLWGCPCPHWVPRCSDRLSLQSCCKAYEYMGFIMEREQSYKDAATNYELAWKYSHYTSPAIGFRLAFNYLKDKRFVEAIEVCRDVLREHPNYPKIREEILEKAQVSLRP